MKSSKYTQATSPMDNDYRDYQNIGTIIPNEPNLNHTRYENSEELLLNHFDYRCNHQQATQPPNHQNHQNHHHERNANSITTRAEDFDTRCQCNPPPPPPNVRHAHSHHAGGRFKQYNSDQNIPHNLAMSLTKLDNAGSQFSLDRKANRPGSGAGNKKHTYTCEQNQKILQKLEMKRMRSPEVINVHRGTPTLLYDPHCDIGGVTIYDDYGFRGSGATPVPAPLSNTNVAGGAASGGGGSARGTLKRQQMER